MTCTIRSSASRNTIWLPTGGLRRWACSSIQRAKLKAASIALESDGEGHLGVGAVAGAIDALLAVEVALLHRAQTDEAVASGLDIRAGARADGVEVRQPVDVRAPVERADIRLQH